MLHRDSNRKIWSPMAGAFIEPRHALVQLACLRACSNTTTARRVYARLYADRQTNPQGWLEASIAGDEEHESMTLAFDTWLNEPRYTTTDVADILR
jgi:hypothetical protein